ncbi:MAG: GspE/PulE family protein [Patescibacteria group bacterium]|nr:GspE/PulE family protein [Patescibacteria group bacterium]
MKTENRKNVEDILAEKGLLTPEQVSAVKFERVNTGKTGEAIIQERGYVGPDELAKARAEILNIPFVEVGSRSIPTQILDLVPQPVAQKYRLIPFAKDGGKLQVAMVDPLDLQVIEFIEKRAGTSVEPYLAVPEDIDKAIGEQYAKSLGTDVTAALEEAGVTKTKIDEQLKNIETANETLRDAPVSRIVSTLLEYAVKARASDIHIEPMGDRTRVRYRIDGVLQERLSIPTKVHNSIVSRIKILSDLKIDEHRLPQDGRFKIILTDNEVDLRVSTLPTVFGEKVVIRLLKEKGRVMTLQQLGLTGISFKRVENNLSKPYGVMLVTGPTGSGKTVTLASCLTQISTNKVNIITLEDPVEIQIPGTNQVQINPQAGLTFASGLRSILRQDPNIIMVGEIRDRETAELSIQAALTGHLVFSTLHTNNAASALPRLLDMEVEAYLLISTINAVIAQRLVRLVCKSCKVSVEMPKEVSEKMKQVLGPLYDQKVKALGGKLSLAKGKGCEQCEHTGYSGRTGIFEVLEMSEKLGQLTLNHRPSSELDAQAIEEGMVTLLQDGFMKVLDGQTTLEEVLRVAEE